MADWEEDFDNPKFWNVVVEHDRALVGSAVGCDARGLLEPRGTRPARPARRSWGSPPCSQKRAASASAALSARRVTAWALEKGYPSLVTDWRETNLLSSRAWRGLGYRDTFTRVHRLVGH